MDWIYEERGGAYPTSPQLSGQPRLLSASRRLARASITSRLPLAYAAGRSVHTLLFGVSPLDAGPYAIAAALLVLVGSLAAFLPAHRASRIDPMVALRNS